MFHEADPSVTVKVHDLMDLADKVLSVFQDELPELSGVVPPLETLVLEFGQPAVDEAVAFLKRCGYGDSRSRGQDPVDLLG